LEIKFIENVDIGCKVLPLSKYDLYSVISLAIFSIDAKSKFKIIESGVAGENVGADGLDGKPEAS
jgi:hypothetical protein